MNKSILTHKFTWIRLCLLILVACCINTSQAMDYNWEQPVRKTVELKGHDQRIHISQISPDESFIVTADIKGIVKIWDTNLGICMHTITTDNCFITCLAISADSLKIALTNETDTVHDIITIWDAITGSLLKTIQSTSRYPIELMNFSSHKSSAASIPCLITGTPGDMICYDYQQGTSLYEVNTLNIPNLESKVLHSTTHTLAFGDSKTYKTHLYDLVSQKVITTFNSPQKKHMLSISSKNQNKLALVCNHNIYLWDITSKQLIKEIDTQQQEEIFHGEFNQNNTHLILYSLCNKFLIWNLEKNCCSASLKNPYNESSLELSHDQNYGMMCSPRENTITLIHIPTHQHIKKFDCYGQSHPQKNIIMSSSGKFISLTTDTTSEAKICFFHKNFFIPSTQSAYNGSLSKLQDLHIRFK